MSYVVDREIALRFRRRPSVRVAGCCGQDPGLSLARPLTKVRAPVEARLANVEEKPPIFPLRVGPSDTHTS